MKIEEIRNHIEITTDKGAIFRISEKNNEIRVVCVSGNIELDKTHGNAINIISDETRKF